MRKPIIMCVDDNVQALELVEAMLGPKGYDVISVDDGSKVIAAIAVKRPDLILLDVMMPGLDGYSTLSQIKENKTLSDIPVVMLTAVGLDLNKELAFQFGAAGYLTKPINHDELLKTISRLIPAFS